MDTKQAERFNVAVRGGEQREEGERKREHQHQQQQQQLGKTNEHQEDQQEPSDQLTGPSGPIQLQKRCPSPQKTPSGQENHQNNNKSSNKQQIQPARAKISHRSQSSPSSLTTHKFGLRPTPSPPRLIIDHNTGDIIESYPEQPVYLRTYQPLEDSLASGDVDDDDDDDSTVAIDDSSFSQAYPSSLASHPQIPNRMSASTRPDPRQQQQQQQPVATSSQHHRAPTNKPFIPPPHSGKVYFAPPVTAANNVLQLDQQPSFSGGGSGVGIHNATFKRALNKLNEGRTDIAIVTEPDDQVRPENTMKITATSVSKGNALLAAQQKQQPRPQLADQTNSRIKSTSSLSSSCSSNKQRQPNPNHSQYHNNYNNSHHNHHQHYEPPAIEDFKLYGFCYNFQILLVLLLSSLIIYLLVNPLNLDCIKFRPTYTYLSIITVSVNLICVTIFTLFWYCNGVTRTLYANLSSSAFIITIYSILVAINLSLAVLFFFINTCHFQKIINTHSPIQSLALVSSVGGLTESEPAMLRLLGAPEAPLVAPLEEPASASAAAAEAATAAIHSIERRQSGANKDEPEAEEQEKNNDQLQDDSDGPDSTYTRPQLRTGGELEQVETTTLNPYEVAPSESPFEAAWEYTKEQFVLLKRKFSQFLITYDLKFIGVLHAVCAICLQYLAIKVAVVRSHYCSPVGLYV